MGPELMSALVSGGFTLLAAIVGFGAIAWQLDRQGRLTREDAKLAQQREFKNQLFHEGVEAAHSMSMAAGEFSSYLRKVQMQIWIAKERAKEGVQFVPDVRFTEIMDHYARFSDAKSDFVFLVEQRRVIDPRMTIFRSAISAASHQFGKRYAREFSQALIPHLPMDMPNGENFPYTPPDDVALEAIEGEIAIAEDAALSCVMYAEDFMVELQNSLLGDIFDQKVEHRDPPDPSARVIRLDQYEELNFWLGGTPWGQECAKIEAEAKECFSGPNSKLCAIASSGRPKDAKSRGK